jgi:hypothetical protein
MSEKVKTVNVKLGAKLAKRGGGLVDPSTGIAISAAKTAGSEGQQVPKTNFIAARLHSGELIEVKSAAPANQNVTEEIEVTFKKKTEVSGREYKAGDKAKVNSVLATTLREEGKIV